MGERNIAPSIILDEECGPLSPLDCAICDALVSMGKKEEFGAIELEIEPRTEICSSRAAWQHILSVPVIIPNLVLKVVLG